MFVFQASELFGKSS